MSAQAADTFNHGKDYMIMDADTDERVYYQGIRHFWEATPNPNNLIFPAISVWVIVL
ncbi:MAG: hypothetical protein ACK502_01390 [Alphaproteobacteria bacterium]